MSETRPSPTGNRTDLAKRLREVHGLHEFAELFGFDWADDSDWTWHDVACAMADAVDAVTACAGTCHKKWRNGYGFCSECGYNITGEWAIYCPTCGRRCIG